MQQVLEKKCIVGEVASWQRERDTCRVEWETCIIMPSLYLNLSLISIAIDSYYSEYILHPNNLKKEQKGGEAFSK